MLKLILKDSLHFDKNTFISTSAVPMLFYIYMYNIFLSRSAYRAVIGLFYIIVFVLYTLFPIKLAKGLYLCPLTEDDRKKYLLTAGYMRFAVVMILYGIVLLVSGFILETGYIILLIQYVFGGIVLCAITLLYVHPGVHSTETAMQTFYSANKIPVNIRPKFKKLNKKTSGISLSLLIIVLILGTIGVMLPINKNKLNPYMWFYFIPSFICSVICIFIYYKKYMNEVLTIYANQEVYHYLKKKAGIFHAD